MNSKGKPLTQALIAQKAKTEALYSIKKLNLWGNDLDDISIVERMPNLEVLSLSVNRINTLSDIAKCKKITELYLRKNNISNVEELKNLQRLPKLKLLWMQENPITDHPYYKELVIVNCPSLEKLDDIVIDNEARANAKQILAQGQQEQINYPPQKQYGYADAQQYQQNIDELNQIQNMQQPTSQQSTPQRYSQQKLNNINQEDNIRQSQVYNQQYQNESNQQNFTQQQLQYLQQQQQQQQQQFLLQQQQQQQQQEQYYAQQLQQQQYQLQMQQQQQGSYNLMQERNENIISAIFSLIRELDTSGLKVVQREVDRQLQEK